MIIKRIHEDEPLTETHLEQIHDNGNISMILISDDSETYIEIMRQVDAGELTIEPADE